MTVGRLVFALWAVASAWLWVGADFARLEAFGLIYAVGLGMCVAIFGSLALLLVLDALGIYKVPPPSPGPQGTRGEPYDWGANDGDGE